MIRVFDSHSREISGLSSPDGTAIVTTHPTKRHLVTFIRDLALSRSLGDSCPFEIVPVFIMVQRTDIMYVDSDSTVTSTSFLGFNTHDDDEYDDDDDDDDGSSDDIPLAQFADIASTNLESSGSEYTLTKTVHTLLEGNISSSELSTSDTEMKGKINKTESNQKQKRVQIKRKR
ncbi:hypothetical protein ACJMK2_008831 [Sinanodonta woodiana]|uniref:Uncharacterized protein n=1 Tax=Sinanodonta woodiana TaxID=1069815 RepID=A0ABD3VN13_SINWO